MRGNCHDNKHLQFAWNKYGEENFEFIIIHDCINGETLEEVNALEIYEIKKYKDLGLAYNIHDGGDGGLFLGKHLDSETKRKIGEKNRIHMTGKKASESTKAKMSESQKERYSKWSEEDRMNWGKLMSECNRGYKWKNEDRVKLKDNKNGAKYTIEIVREIRRLHEQENKGYTEISKILNIPRPAVYLIATYRRWKNAI